MFSDDLPSSKEKDQTLSLIENFKQKIGNIENQLSTVFELHQLKKYVQQDERGNKIFYDGFLSWLQLCITGIQQPIALSKNPIYLDAVIGGQELHTGITPKIGKNFIQAIAIDGFPSESFPGILSQLSELAIEYRWSTRFIFLDHHEARNLLKDFRRKWRQKVRGFFDQIFHTNSGSINIDALSMVEDADAAIADIDSGLGAGYYSSNIILFNENRFVLEQQAKQIEKIIQRLGFSVRIETINNLEAFLGSLPGHGFENIRRPLLNTLNLADLLPTSSTWLGNKQAPCPMYEPQAPALMKCITKGATPFYFNLHVRDVGHSLMFGPTGSGKSTHLAIIAAQLRRYKDISIFVFDKGMSMYPLTKAMGGSHFSLANEDENLSFCPLQFLESNADIAWATQWIESILILNGTRITPEIHNAIEIALKSMQQTNCQTLTEFVNTVQSAEIRDIIVQYTHASPMGYLLDAEEDGLNLSNFTVFEIEELMNLPEKYALPVLLYLFWRIERSLKGQPAAIILDEAWLMLGHSVFKNKIKEWLKVLRKANCFVLMATQSLSDAANSDIFDSILESTATKIFLPNIYAKNDETARLYKKMGLNSQQIQIVATAIPKKHYYFLSEEGQRLYELNLGPLALAFTAASSKDDIATIKELEKSYSQNWVEKWLEIREVDFKGL